MIIHSKFTLTRMLYIKDEVIFMMIRSLIERSTMKDALYWFSELYYSGFVEDIWDTAFLVYYIFYANSHPKFELVLYKKWLAFQNSDSSKNVVIMNGKKGAEHHHIGKRVDLPKQMNILVGIIKSLYYMKWDGKKDVFDFCRSFIRNQAYDEECELRKIELRTYKGRRVKWFTSAFDDNTYYKEIRSIVEKHTSSLLYIILEGNPKDNIAIFGSIFKHLHSSKLRYSRKIQSCISQYTDSTNLPNLLTYKYFHMLWCLYENNGVLNTQETLREKCPYMLTVSENIEYIQNTNVFHGRNYKYLNATRNRPIDIDWMRSMGFTLTRDYVCDWILSNCENKKTYDKDFALKWIIYYHWLFFAYRCPLWKKRIKEYNGYRCYKNTRVVFDNDDDLENFYDMYGIEPDEQTRVNLTGAYGKEFFDV